MTKVDLTLSLTPAENNALNELAEASGLTPQGVMRQALRVYQHVTFRARKGESLAFTDAAGRLVPPSALRMSAGD